MENDIPKQKIHQDIIKKSLRVLKKEMEKLYKELLNCMSIDLTQNKIFLKFERQINESVRKLQELVDFLEDLENKKNLKKSQENC